MAPPDPARMTETIAAAFMQRTQERALDKKISALQDALQETNASLRDRQQANTKAWGETIITLENRHNQEIQSLREAIDCLQGQLDGLKKHNEEIDSLKETVKSLHCLATQTESDNSRLHDEIAELRAQLRSRHQGENSRRPHESQQKFQEPWQRLPRDNQSSEDTYEETLLHQHEDEEEDVQFPPASAHGHSLPQSLEQPHPRGVKRAHVGDAAEPPPPPPHPRRVAPAQAEDDANDSPQPRRFTMSTGSRARAHHDDEVARREEERQARAENDAATRKRDFEEYVWSMREKYYSGNYGTNQRVFFRRFIDGIQDPVLSRWFQESLGAKFPEKVHEEKRSTRKAGSRIVTPTRDLNWEDIVTVLRETQFPSVTD